MKNLSKIGFLAVIAILLAAPAWSAGSPNHAFSNDGVYLAGNGNGHGHGPGDGTGNDGDGPGDGTGNGPGDCSMIKAASALMAKNDGRQNAGSGNNGGYGPGDGTGTSGGPKDGTGNGPGGC